MPIDKHTWKEIAPADIDPGFSHTVHMCTDGVVTQTTDKPCEELNHD